MTLLLLALALLLVPVQAAFKVLVLRVNCGEEAKEMLSRMMTQFFPYSLSYHCVTNNSSPVSDLVRGWVLDGVSFVMVEDPFASGGYVSGFEPQMHISLYMYYYCGFYRCTTGSLHDVCPLKMVEKSVLSFHSKRFFAAASPRSHESMASLFYLPVSLVAGTIAFESSGNVDDFKALLAAQNATVCASLAVYLYHSLYSDILSYASAFSASSCRSQGASLVLVYPIDELTASRNQSIFSSVYTLTGYTSAVSTQEFTAFKTALGNDVAYMDDFIYSLYVYLHAVEPVVDSMASFHYHHSMLYASIRGSTKINPMGAVSFGSTTYSVHRGSFLARYPASGAPVPVYELFTEIKNTPMSYSSHSCLDVPYTTNNTVFFGFASSSPSDVASISSFEGLYTAFEEIQIVSSSLLSLKQNITLSQSGIYLTTGKGITNITQQIDYLQRLNAVILFLYLGTDGVQSITDYYESKQLLLPTFILGLDSGQDCHPSLFHISTSFPSQLQLLGSAFPASYIFVYSNTAYGVSCYEYLKFSVFGSVPSVAIQLTLDTVDSVISRISALASSYEVVIAVLGGAYTSAFLQAYRSSLGVAHLILLDVSVADDVNLFQIPNIVTIQGFLGDSDLRSRFSRLLGVSTPTHHHFYGFVAVKFADQVIRDYQTVERSLIINGLPQMRISLSAHANIVVSFNHYLQQYMYYAQTPASSPSTCTDPSDWCVLKRIFYANAPFEPAYLQGTSIFFCSWDTSMPYLKSMHLRYIVADSFTGGVLSKVLMELISNQLYDNYHTLVVPKDSDPLMFLAALPSGSNVIALVGEFGEHEAAMCEYATRHELPYLSTAVWRSFTCELNVFHMGVSLSQLLYTVSHEFILPAVFFLSDCASEDDDPQYQYLKMLLTIRFHDGARPLVFRALRDYFNSSVSDGKVAVAARQLISEIETTFPSGCFVHVAAMSLPTELFSEAQLQPTFLPKYQFVVYKQYKGVDPEWAFLTGHYLIAPYFAPIVYTPELLSISLPGTTSNSSHFSLLQGYDILNLLFVALESAGDKKLAAALNGAEFVSPYEGLIYVERNNHLNRPLNIYRVKPFLDLEVVIPFPKPIQGRTYGVLPQFCDALTYPYTFNNTLFNLGLIYDENPATERENQLFLRMSAFMIDYILRKTTTYIVFKPFLCRTGGADGNDVDQCLELMKTWLVRHVIANVPEASARAAVAKLESEEMMMYFTGYPLFEPICSETIVTVYPTQDFISAFNFLPVKHPYNKYVFVYDEYLGSIAKGIVMINSLEDIVHMLDYSTYADLPRLFDDVFSLIPENGAIVLALTYSRTNVAMDYLDGLLPAADRSSYQFLLFSDVIQERPYRETHSITFVSTPLNLELSQALLEELKGALGNPLYCSQVECLTLAAFFLFQSLLVHSNSDNPKDIYLVISSLDYDLPVGLASVSIDQVLSYPLSLSLVTESGETILLPSHKLVNVMEKGWQTSCKEPVRTIYTLGLLLTGDMMSAENREIQKAATLMSQEYSYKTLYGMDLRFRLVPLNVDSETPTAALETALSDGLIFFFGVRDTAGLLLALPLIEASGAIAFTLFPNEQEVCSKSVYVFSPSLPDYIMFLMNKVIRENGSKHVVILHSDSSGFGDYSSVISEIKYHFTTDPYTFSISPRTRSFDSLVQKLSSFTYDGSIIIALIPFHQVRDMMVSYVEQFPESGYTVFICFDYYSSYSLDIDSKSVALWVASPFHLDFEGDYYDALRSTYDNVIGGANLSINTVFMSAYLSFAFWTQALDLSRMETPEDIIEKLEEASIDTPWGSYTSGMKSEENQFRFPMNLFEVYPGFALVHATSYTYLSSPYFPRSEKHCSPLGIYREIIQFAFLYSLSGPYKSIDSDLYLASIAAFNSMTDSLKYSFSYIIYDMESDPARCQSAVDFLGRAAVVLFGYLPECLPVFKKYQETHTTMFFTAARYSGGECQPRLITVSGFPNQVISRGLYSIAQLFDYSSLYIVYDGEYSVSTVYYSIAEIQAKLLFTNISSFDVSTMAMDQIITRIDSKGIILYLGFTEHVVSFMNHLDMRRMNRVDYPIVTALVPQSFIQAQEGGLFRNTYVWTTYIHDSLTGEYIDHFRNIIMDLLGVEYTTEQMFDTFLIFDLLAKLRSSESMANIDVLYEVPVQTLLGDIHIPPSNAMPHPFVLGIIEEDGLARGINVFSVLMSADVYNWPLVPGRKCNVLKPAETTEEAYRIALVSDLYTRIVDMPFYKDFDGMVENQNQNILREQYVLESPMIISTSECPTLGQMYESMDIKALFLYVSYECLRSSFALAGETKKIFWVFSNSFGDVTIQNYVFSGRYLQSYVLQSLNFISARMDQYFALMIHSSTYSEEYTKLSTLIKNHGYDYSLVQADDMSPSTIQRILQSVTPGFNELAIIFDGPEEQLDIFYTHISQEHRNASFIVMSLFHTYSARPYLLDISSSPDPAVSETIFNMQVAISTWHRYVISKSLSSCYGVMELGPSVKTTFMQSNYFSMGLRLSVNLLFTEASSEYSESFEMNPYLVISDSVSWCDWKLSKPLVVRPVVYVAFLLDISGPNRRLEKPALHAILSTFYRHWYGSPISFFNTFLSPVVFNTRGDPETARRQTQAIVDRKFPAAFGPFTYAIFRDVSAIMEGSSTLFFYTGPVVASECYTNVISAGRVMQFQVEYFTTVILNQTRPIVLITDAGPESQHLLEWMSARLQSQHFPFRAVNVEAFDKAGCSADGCLAVDILSPQSSEALLNVLPLDEANNITMYSFNFEPYFLLGENASLWSRVRSINSILSNASLSYTSQFVEIQSKVPLPERQYCYSSYYEALYTSLNIFVDTTMRTESLDLSRILGLVHNQFYESPMKLVYLYSMNYMDKGYTAGEVTTSLTLQPIYSTLYYADLKPLFTCDLGVQSSSALFQSRPLETTLALEEKEEEEETEAPGPRQSSSSRALMKPLDEVVVLLVLPNYTPFRESSLAIVLVATEVINQQNYLGGLNTRFVTLRVVMLDNYTNMSALEVALADPLVVYSFGCTCAECLAAVRPLVDSARVPFMTFVRPPSYECSANIFSLTYQIESGLVLASSYMKSNTVSTVILVYQIEGYVQDLVRYMSLLQGTGYFQHVQPIGFHATPKDGDNSESYRVLSEMIASQNATKMAFVNLLPFGPLMNEFIDMITEQYGFDPMRNINLLFNYDPFIMGMPRTQRLRNHFTVAAFISDQSISITSSFLDFIKSRMGESMVASSYSFSVHTALRILSNSVVTAQKLVVKDGGKASTWPSFEYIRFGIETTSVESITGIFQPNLTHQYSIPLFIGEIISPQAVYKVFSEYSVSYPESDANCSFGAERRMYRFFNIRDGLAMFFLPIVGVYQIMLASLVFHFRSRKLIKYASPVFLIYIAISSLVLLMSVFLFNVVRTNDSSCSFNLLFMFLAMNNIICALVFKTWRIHALLFNAALRKMRLSNTVMFGRIWAIILVNFVIGLVWYFIHPMAQHYEYYFAGPSTSIISYYLDQCSFNLFYVVLELVFFFVMFGFGTYYAWSTRVADDEFNESRSLGVAIGTLVILTFIILLVYLIMQENPEISLMIQVIITGLCGIVITSFMLLPKFYVIYNTQSSSDLSGSGKKGSHSQANQSSPSDPPKKVLMPASSVRMANLRQIPRKPVQLQMMRDDKHVKMVVAGAAAGGDVPEPLERASMSEASVDDSESDSIHGSRRTSLAVAAGKPMTPTGGALGAAAHPRVSMHPQLAPPLQAPSSRSHSPQLIGLRSSPQTTAASLLPDVASLDGATTTEVPLRSTPLNQNAPPGATVSPLKYSILSAAHKASLLTSEHSDSSGPRPSMVMTDGVAAVLIEEGASLEEGSHHSHHSHRRSSNRVKSSSSSFIDQNGYVDECTNQPIAFHGPGEESEEESVSPLVPQGRGDVVAVPARSPVVESAAVVPAEVRPPSVGEGSVGIRSVLDARTSPRSASTRPQVQEAQSPSDPRHTHQDSPSPLVTTEHIHAPISASRSSSTIATTTTTTSSSSGPPTGSLAPPPPPASHRRPKANQVVPAPITSDEDII